MAPLEQLDAYLADHSYLGSEGSATQVDYAQCKEIQSVDEQKFPHLARWHEHVTHLLAVYPKCDWRGEPVPAGKAPALGSEAAKPAVKAEAKAASKKEEKKEAAPKKEAGKKQKGGKDEKDKLKKVVKEGGKRGVEIEGAADMGGLQFFCTSMDLPEGDLDLLVESMKAMNAKSDPTEEERKGGSGHIGKMIFSAGTEQLAVVAYVPEAKQSDLSCEEWLKAVLSTFGGDVVSAGAELSTGAVKTNSDKGVFPLKIREPLILEANNFLRKKGLFPDNDGDDDDDYVFGDDDFPS